MANSVHAVLDLFHDARKVRLVIDTVRGLGADEALDLLKSCPRQRRAVSKTIRSAIANAEENQGWSRDDLFVSEIRADEGPRRQWRRLARAAASSDIQAHVAHHGCLTEREQVA